MALTLYKYLNACVWVPLSSGTGSFVVDTAVSGYFVPASCTNPAVVNGGTYRYFARDASGNHEEGVGVWTTSTSTLTRATILSSSNANAVVNFPGIPTVSMGAALAADMIVVPDTVSAIPVAPTLAVLNGKPWADVTAWGAVSGGSATTNATAIQAAIDYMNSTYAGGIVFVPPGNYSTDATLTIKGGVRLVGASRSGTTIGNIATDTTVIAFDTSCSYAAIEGLFIVGYLHSSAANPCVTVGLNIPVVMKDCFIWGGLAGVYTQGVDGYMENCFVNGYTYAVLSAGANWFVRCKFDTALGSNVHCFYQAAASGATGVVENHLTQCDLSGSYTDSYLCNDGSASPQSITHFDGCVFSAPISILRSKVTLFTGCELGSATLSVNGAVAISGSYAFTAINLAGTGAQVAGCVNITG